MNSTGFSCSRRAVGSKNPGGGTRSNVVGIICPLVELGLADLPKSGREWGGKKCPPAPHQFCRSWSYKDKSLSKQTLMREQMAAN